MALSRPGKQPCTSGSLSGWRSFAAQLVPAWRLSPLEPTSLLATSRMLPTSCPTMTLTLRTSTWQPCSTWRPTRIPPSALSARRGLPSKLPPRPTGVAARSASSLVESIIRLSITSFRASITRSTLKSRQSSPRCLLAMGFRTFITLPSPPPRVPSTSRYCEQIVMCFPPRRTLAASAFDLPLSSEPAKAACLQRCTLPYLCDSSDDRSIRPMTLSSFVYRAGRAERRSVHRACCQKYRRVLFPHVSSPR
mmetsp:Transcript_2323/g.7128  ORF Transcript_2323/g.7128 Transcript_2323/m.7128 type:complete len:250 (-) Transcript_2323:367-1116(-)